MYEDILRIIGVAIVGVVLILPPGKYLDIMYNREYQIVAGLFVITSILFIDAIFGALLGLAVLIWFSKMNYRRLVSDTLSSISTTKSKPLYYGTSQNLVDVQTNTVNESMMNTEMIGFDGIYGEQVIGAQGLDKTMPGFDKNKADIFAPIK